MKKHKYSDLLLYEERIKNLYSKFGLGFNPTNRIANYFKYLNDIEKYRISNLKQLSKLIEKDKVKYYFSQFFLLEICNIVDAVESSSQDGKIIKAKLFDLAKGTYLLSEESSANTKARDTTFELSLFSFLQQKRLNVRLCDPNPDLRLVSDKYTYNIECKRPFSYKSIEENITEAMAQLEKSRTQNSIPTIALSLEQVLLGNSSGVDLILNSINGTSALSFLDRTLYKFLQDNNSLLGKICGQKSYLVLYYISCLTGLQDEAIMANATFITGNIFNFENRLGNSIVEDLYEMVPTKGLLV